MQAHEGQITHYSPKKLKDKLGLYFCAHAGLPRRISRTIYKGIPVIRFCEPKLGPTAPRTEAVSRFDPINNECYFFLKFLIPGEGNDCWEEDLNSYTVICQWHEHKQPYGGRRPPFEIYLQDSISGLKLNLAISHDSGTGISGRKDNKENTLHFELGEITLDQEYSLTIQAKASGQHDDFVNCWINSEIIVSYKGYCGYPNGELNFFKVGVYCYSGQSGANKRVMYLTEFAQGDKNESYHSMNSIVNSKLNNSNTNTESKIHFILGSIELENTLKANNLTLQYSNNGIRVYEAHSGSIFVYVEEYLNSLNLGLVSCCSYWRPNHSYAFGSIIVPRDFIGASIYTPLGFKFICIKSGTSGLREPLWAEKDYQKIDDGDVLWISEKREHVDTENHILENGEIGYDPNGTISAILAFYLQKNFSKIAIHTYLPNNEKSLLPNLYSPFQELGLTTENHHHQSFSDLLVALNLTNSDLN